MKLRILFFSMVFIVGCATNERKAKQYYLNNKDQLAELCSDCFPVIDRQVITGKEIALKPDTVYKTAVRTNFVELDCPDGSRVKGDCPSCDSTIIYLPFLRVDTLVKADSAAIYHWQSEFKKADGEKKEAQMETADIKANRDFYRKWFWILAVAIGLKIGHWFFTTFTLRNALKK